MMLYCVVALYLAPIECTGRLLWNRRIIFDLKYCMINNYFPFKIVLFCWFPLMLAIKPRALHTIRRFSKRLSKKV